MNNNENKKLKIGILTFHRAHNYGAVLQCYALQETLKSLGYDACVIDYRSQAVEAPYSIISWYHLKKIIKSPRKLQGYIRRIPSRIISNKVYSQFIRKLLVLSQKCCSFQDIPAMEIYVVGSDQMWNFKITGGCDKVYTGNFIRSKKSLLFGYAISANEESLENISNESLRDICYRFDGFSFREQGLSNIIYKRIGLRVNTDIDPTLLKDRSFWDDFTNNRFGKRNYVLLYQVRRPKHDKTILDRKAQQLANIMHCELININHEIYSPEDFVSLFKYAKCVITSSFHAVAFSVIFERPLYAVMLHDGHDDRYINLLKSIDAEKLLVETDFQPALSHFDYSITNLLLKELRETSLSSIKRWTTAIQN